MAIVRTAMKPVTIRFCLSCERYKSEINCWNLWQSWPWKKNVNKNITQKIYIFIFCELKTPTKRSTLAIGVAVAKLLLLHNCTHVFFIHIQNPLRNGSGCCCCDCILLMFSLHIYERRAMRKVCAYERMRGTAWRRRNETFVAAITNCSRPAYLLT